MAEAEQDHYEMVGVHQKATRSEIRRAYRDRARDLHPDKNRDDPNAAARFDALKKASEVLLDEALRGEYDRKWEAKQAAKARYQAMDQKRQQQKRELEASEAAAAAAVPLVPTGDTAASKAFLDALRASNLQLRKRVAQDLSASRQAAASDGGAAAVEASRQRSKPAPAPVRLRWTPEVGRTAFALASDDALPRNSAVERLMARFGSISKVRVTAPGVATVTFAAESSAARAAMAAPPGFKVSLIKGQRTPAPRSRGTKRGYDGSTPLVEALPKLRATAGQLAETREAYRTVREVIRRKEGGGDK